MIDNKTMEALLKIKSYCKNTDCCDCEIGILVGCDECLSPDDPYRWNLDIKEKEK